MIWLRGRRIPGLRTAVQSMGRRAWLLGQCVVTALPFCLWLTFAVIGAVAVILFNPEKTTTQTLGTLALPSEQQSRNFVHVKARARVAPSVDFAEVSLTCEMQPVEMWRTENPSPLWLIHSGERAVITDGHDAYSVCGIPDSSQTSYCGTAICSPRIGFVSPLLWGAALFEVEEKRSWQRGLTVNYSRWNSRQGEEKVTVTITPPAHLKSVAQPPAEPMSWFDLRNSKRYVFDTKTSRLESASIFVTINGRDVVVFETEKIDYLKESDGEIAIAEAVANLGL